jgi:hypothetical protein
MDFFKSNWLTNLKLYTLWVYIAVFPLLSGCEHLNNLPCEITHSET